LNSVQILHHFLDRACYHGYIISMDRSFIEKISCITFVIFLSGNISAQEIPDETNELPPIILERDWLYFSQGWYQYQYLDGTLLKYKDVRPIISVVPENEKVLRQERGWLVTNLVSASLFLYPHHFSLAPGWYTQFMLMTACLTRGL